MTAPTLTEFLLARIAEDEAGAQDALSGGSGVWESGEDALDECRVEGDRIVIYDEGGHTPEQARHIARHDPARVLAECEAKRRVVEEHPIEERASEFGCTTCNYDRDYLWQETGPCVTLRSLAAVYADHPDYDEAWRA